jgi:hypothetical protein
MRMLSRILIVLMVAFTAGNAAGDVTLPTMFSDHMVLQRDQALNVRFTEQVWKWLDEIDRNAIRDCLHRHDFLTVRKMMEPYIFPLLRSAK